MRVPDFGVAALAARCRTARYRRRLGRRNPVLTTTRHPDLLGSILAALWFVIPAVNTIVVSYQMGVTPDRLQGQVYASMNLVANSSAPLGSLAGGFLLTAVGSTRSLLVLTAVMITVVVAASASTTLRNRWPDERLFLNHIRG